MRRGRRTVEVIGMPFLDMISCAFGGVVVLYLITPSTDPAEEPFVVTPIVELRTADNAPFMLGTRFMARGEAAECFEVKCPAEPGAVREWSRAQGRLTAVLADAATRPESLEVAVVSGPGFFTEDCVSVRAEFEGKQRFVKLTFDTGFRLKIDNFDNLSATEESCP